MSDKPKEIVLIGGDKNGEVIEWGQGISQINHVKVNEDLDGPMYVDHYVPSQLLDRDGRVIYVAEGRYDAEESKTFWDSLDETYRAQLIEAAKEENAAEEAAKEEASEEISDNDADNATGQSDSGSGTASSEEAPVEEVPGEPAGDDEKAGEEAAEKAEADTSNEGSVTEGSKDEEKAD